MARNMTTSTSSTTFTGDETYLEAFMDHITTVPHELRRNLNLMKDLDLSGSKLLKEMTKLHSDYIEKVENKMNTIEVAEDGKGVRVMKKQEPSTATTKKSKNDEDDDGGTSTRKSDRKKNKKGKGDDDKDNDDNEVPSVVIPTTEELMRYVHDPPALSKIESVEQDCLQRAEEKVAIAKQTYSLIDDICQRLDVDILDMEKLLLATGEFQTPGGTTITAQPNDLAAIQVQPGSTDWILGKVMSYDPQTGMYKLSDEDVESNKIFNLPESQVIILGTLKNIKVGENVYAVYPDTTSFYQGTISQAPRKASGGGGSYVMISFLDDHDEHGITHDKAVLMKHVMLPP